MRAEIYVLEHRTGTVVTEPIDVAVVGGGLVGLCLAESLSRRGAETAVLESGTWGGGASAGNAGWVSPGLSNPLPAPGTMAQALRWLPNPRSPLLIRPPRRLGFLAWSYDFWRATRQRPYSAGLAALTALTDRTIEDFRDLASRGVEFEMHEDGILFVARTEKALETERVIFEDMGAVGGRSPFTELDPEQAREQEPALAGEPAGAIFSPRECHVRPESVSSGLVRHLSENGVAMREGETVHSLTREGGRWVLRTSGETVRADAVVVAAGVTTRDLLAPLGVRLPMEGAKGYSVTYEDPGLHPRGPLYLLEDKIAVSPFDRALRFAGTLELGARDAGISPARLRAVETGGRRALRDFTYNARRVDWAGFRPLTPDGLPVLGPVPGWPGLSVATGHSMLGITLAPTSGELMAPAVLEGGPPLELAAFSIARFGNLARR